MAKGWTAHGSLTWSLKLAAGVLRQMRGHFGDPKDLTLAAEQLERFAEARGAANRNYATRQRAKKKERQP
jgi:hypothetical protein